MSSKEKLVTKIRNNPSDVSLEDLIKLMEVYGFKPKKTNEGYMFYHNALRDRHQIPRVANPHGKSGKKVKKSYVISCLEAIDVLLEVSE